MLRSCRQTRAWQAVCMIGLLLFALTGCVYRSQKSSKATPPTEQKAPSDEKETPPKGKVNRLEINEVPSTFCTNMFIRLTASATSDDFIRSHLVQDLPVANAVKEFHVTLATVTADKAHSQKTRCKAMHKVALDVTDELRSQKSPLTEIAFPVDSVHTFPGNLRFIELTTDVGTAQAISSLQEAVFRQIGSTLQRENFQAMLKLDPNSNPQIFLPHLSVFGTAFKAPILTPVVFGDLVDTITKRKDSLKNTNKMQDAALPSLVISY